MNKDFLPSIYQEMASTKSKKDYQNDFIGPMLNYKNEIQWIIDYISRTLKGIRFRALYPLNEEKKKNIQEYRKERQEQLDTLSICELNIKQETNNLLNAVAGSNDQKWDDDDLIKIEGFQGSSLVEILDKPIPLPIQSIIYILSARYCLLTKCAINAMILKNKVDMFINQYPYTKIGKDLEEIKETLDKQKKITPNIQDDLAQWVRKGIINYCRKHPEIVEAGIKFPKETSMIRLFNHWNRYLNASEDQKEKMKEFKPYPKYVRILYASQEEVEEWGEEVFTRSFIEAKRQKKEEKAKKKKIDALDRWKVGGNAAETMMDLLAAKEDSEN